MRPEKTENLLFRFGTSCALIKSCHQWIRLGVRAEDYHHQESKQLDVSTRVTTFSLILTILLELRGTLPVTNRRVPQASTTRARVASLSYPAYSVALRSSSTSSLGMRDSSTN